MLCILVHGTFAPEAEWINDDATIGQAIKKKWPDAKIHPFRWSGRNSHSARKQAGYELATTIQKLRERSKDDIVLIAHSHGGNVVLYAMRNADIQTAVKGCIFLGTPFLSIKRREISKVIPLICALTPLIAFASIVITIEWFAAFLYVIGQLSGGILIGLSLAAFPALRRRIIIKPWELWSQFVEQKLTKAQDRFFDHVRFPLLTKPSLIVASPKDEAYVWLRTLDWGASVAFHPMPYVATLVRQWPLACTIAFFAVWLDHFQGEKSYVLQKVAIYPICVIIISALIFLVLQLFAVLLPTLLRGHRFGFGWEGLFASAVVSVSPIDRPLSNESVTMYETPDALSRKGLLHSSYYTSPAVSEQIVAWLSSTLDFKNIDFALPASPNPARYRGVSSKKITIIPLLESKLRHPNTFAKTIIVFSVALGFLSAWIEESIPHIETKYDSSKYVIEELIVGPLRYEIQIPAKSEVKKRFEIGKKISEKHCHVIGEHEAATSKVELNIKLDDWVTMTREHIQSIPNVTQELKKKLKPLDEQTMTSVYSSPNGPKKVNFDRHLRLKKMSTDYGEATFLNSSLEPTYASLRLSIICLKNR